MSDNDDESSEQYTEEAAPGESYDQYTEETVSEESYDHYTEETIHEEPYEQYTEEQTIGWGARINNSLRGIVIGILCFFFSFLILTWNEGHADLAQVAKNTVQISSSYPNRAHIGKLVSATGIITSDKLLGDNLFLRPGKYIAIARAVEMYSWVETQSTETKTNLGGSETQRKTFTYTKEWIDSEWILNRPNSSTNSSSFRYPENHRNPKKSVQNAAYKVSSAKVGIFNLDMASIQLPSANSVYEAFDSNVMVSNEGVPTPNPIIPTRNIIVLQRAKLAGNYLYKGAGSQTRPRLGDLRIRYAALNANTNVTVMGKLNSSNSISTYIHSNNHRLFRIFPGTKEQAVSRLNREDVFTWILRLCGFVVMWLGLQLILEPISVVLDFFPILGWLSRGITSYSTFLISLILTIVTILIYHVKHNNVELAITLLANLFVTTTLHSQKKLESAAKKRL